MLATALKKKEQEWFKEGRMEGQREGRLEERRETARKLKEEGVPLYVTNYI